MVTWGRRRDGHYVFLRLGTWTVTFAWWGRYGLGVYWDFMVEDITMECVVGCLALAVWRQTEWGDDGAY